MPYKQICPIVDLSVRSLCTRPYYNHPRGCPNYGKKVGCPPGCPLLCNLIDLSKPVYIIWNAFDFRKHCQGMEEKHPDWTERQVECCLYWQPKARKQLFLKVAKFREMYKDFVVIKNPEGAGVNVTATMKTVGINLEWPPRNLVYQVVLAGLPRNGGL